MNVKKYNLRACIAPQRGMTEVNGKEIQPMRIYRTATSNNESERKRNTTYAYLSHRNEQ